jgi:hypothetical protein
MYYQLKIFLKIKQQLPHFQIPSKHRATNRES